MSRREYKNNLFCLLMKEKEYALQVYNAFNGTDYDNPDDIEIHMHGTGIKLEKKNDSSFLIAGQINLYEHQSTSNPNMPLRSLLHFCNVVTDFIEDENIYGNRLIKIPEPRFIVLYNGVDDNLEREVMRLSDAYESYCDNPELELRCTVYNINPGHNEPLVRKCEVLRGYQIVVEKIRQGVTEGKDIKLAIKDAINWCICNDVLADFLRRNREEVMEVSAFEWSYEKERELFVKEAKEEGLRQGREEGRKTGQNDAVISMAKRSYLRGTSSDVIIQDIMDELNISVEEAKLIFDNRVVSAD